MVILPGGGIKVSLSVANTMAYRGNICTARIVEDDFFDHFCTFCQELIDDLDKKKHDLRTVNKSGQMLVRNLDSQEKIEADLDKLSDDYYLIIDKAKDKRDRTKDVLNKVTYLLEIITEIEIWIEEVHVRLYRMSNPTTDCSVIKSYLEEIQVRKLTLRFRDRPCPLSRIYHRIQVEI